MKALWPEGARAVGNQSVPENMKTATIFTKVNKWIERQPRSLIEPDKVSREVVERLVDRRKPVGK
jgi:hypothetical protein